MAIQQSPLLAMMCNRKYKPLPPKLCSVLVGQLVPLTANRNPFPQGWVLTCDLATYCPRCSKWQIFSLSKGGCRWTMNFYWSLILIIKFHLSLSIVWAALCTVSAKYLHIAADKQVRLYCCLYGVGTSVSELHLIENVHNSTVGDSHILTFTKMGSTGLIIAKSAV